MEYLIGALITAFFFISLYCAYRLGQMSRKPVHREVDEDQKHKAEQLRKGFEQLMSYDVSKAIGRKG